VILFTRNYQDIHQIKKLIGEIPMINPGLLIAVDHEGGRVQRFIEGFPLLPSMAKLGELYDPNPEQSVKKSFS
jgi:Beta-glucosidase-related glycosidases